MAEDISFLCLSQRLAKKLHALGQVYGERTPDGIRIGVPLCQQELANLIVTSRESVNKQLRLWEAEDVVRMNRGFLTIRNIQKLTSLADDPCHRSGLVQSAG